MTDSENIYVEAIAPTIRLYIVHYSGRVGFRSSADQSVDDSKVKVTVRLAELRDGTMIIIMVQ